MCDLRGKSGKLKYGFCSKIVLNENGGPLFQCLKQEPLIDKFENVLEKFNPCTDSHEKITADCDQEYEDDENDEFDVSVLRNLVKLQRRRANAALAELEKERAASATAAEEAMAMIMRLQNEKSLVEMESSQYRRLAEEKQIHDQKVIESLQWLVWRHESERGLLEDQLKSCKRAMKRLSKIDESEEAEEAGSSFHGNILEDLKNVLYSSREANFVN